MGAQPILQLKNLMVGESREKVESWLPQGVGFTPFQDIFILIHSNKSANMPQLKKVERKQPSQIKESNNIAPTLRQG